MAHQWVAIRALNSSARTRLLSRASLSAPTGLNSVASGTGGTLAAATYFYKVTAIGDAGETIGSNETSKTTTGTTSSVALTWNAVAGAVSYRIYRGTATNAENTYYTSTTASYTDTGSAGTAGTVPTSNTAIGNLAERWVIETDDVIVDLVDVASRKKVNYHLSIGQWCVSAVNASTGVTALTANS